MKRYEPEFRALAREWLDRLDGKDEFDLHRVLRAVRERVAPRVIGYDVDDLDPLDEWTTVLACGCATTEPGCARPGRNRRCTSPTGWR